MYNHYSRDRITLIYLYTFCTCMAYTDLKRTVFLSLYYSVFFLYSAEVSGTGLWESAY